MTMRESSGILKAHQPCPTCDSSDACTYYRDGSAYCFSCSTYHPRKDLTSGEDCATIDTIGITNRDTSTYYNNNSRLHRGDSSKGNTKGMNIGKLKEYVPFRGVNQQTLRKYDIHYKVDGATPTHEAYPYPNGAMQYRVIGEKTFFSEGPMSKAPLFGMDKFPKGCAKYITVTEGALDAASAHQMLGVNSPCVAVISASTAEKQCQECFDYLNSFERIYLCLDSDNVGQMATRKVAALFPVDKVYYVKLDKHKDANDYLTKGDEKVFVQTWWASKIYQPKGLIGGYEGLCKALEEEDNKTVAEYPFATLNDMLYGIRLNEFNLFTAQEGIGKTEIFRAIEYHLLKETDYTIGVIHLEEKEKRAIQGLLGYHLKKPVHLPDSNVTLEEQKDALHDMLPDPKKLWVYSHFGTDDPQQILDMIRYMVVVHGCKFVFLDHISMLVSGLGSENERSTLDQLATQLARMTRDLNFTLFAISHVNDDDKTRGSRYIAKVADCVLHMDRNKEAATLTERNKTKLTLKKNRFGGRTGPAGYLYFKDASKTIEELSIADIETEGDIASLPSF